MDLSKGNYWIGHPAHLLPLPDYAGVIEIASHQEPVLTESLGGGIRARIKRARPPRSWKVDIPDTHVDEVAQVRLLLNSTLGPYVWVDPWAQVTNVLTPEQSTMGSLVSPAEGLPQNGGGWRLIGTDGQQAALTRSNPTKGYVRVGPAPIPPAIANRAVTASCWISSTTDAWVVLQWLDGSGNVVASEFGNTVTGMDGLRRSVATGKPPWGAAACRIQVSNAEVLAMPAVTWTSDAVEWDVGNGVQQVVVGGMSRATAFAVPEYRELRRADLSFTVTEVGPAEVMG